MPMPPTRSDIPATAARRVDIISLVLVIIEESFLLGTDVEIVVIGLL